MSVYATIQFERSGHQQVPAELDPKGEGLVYGQNIPKMYKELDAMARKAGVKPISSFFDDAELEDEDRAEMGVPSSADNWFDVSAGLATVKALIAGLVAKGANEDKLWDLRASECVLKKAGPTERFRYSVG